MNNRLLVNVLRARRKPQQISSRSNAMIFTAIIIAALAIYGLLALLFQSFHRIESGPVARYGGVIDASTDKTLGYLPPELRAIDRRMLAVLATA